MDNIADELWFCDAQGNLVLANRAGLRNLGFAELLRQFGCDYAQGFLLARPQSAERIQSFLTN